MVDECGVCVQEGRLVRSGGGMRVLLIERELLESRRCVEVVSKCSALSARLTLGLGVYEEGAVYVGMLVERQSRGWDQGEVNVCGQCV